MRTFHAQTVCGMIATLRGSYAVAAQPQVLSFGMSSGAQFSCKAKTNKVVSLSHRSCMRMAGALLSSLWLPAIGFEWS